MLRKSLLLAGFIFLSIFSGYSATFFSQNSDNFSTLSNWNTDPGGAGSVATVTDLTDGTNTFVIQDGHIIIIDQDIDVDVLTVGNGASGTLTFGNDATIRNVVVRGDLTVSAGGTLDVATFAAVHILTLQGNFTNNGTIQLFNTFSQQAAIIIDGTVNIGGANTPQLGNVTFSTGTGTTNVSVDIEGSVSIANGATFADGDLNHTVAGDWSETGSGQRTGNGTITFDASTTQFLTTTATFNNVIFGGGGSATVSGNMTVLGDITINNSSTVVTSSTHTLRGDFILEALSTFRAPAGIVIFDASITQNISLLGSIEFDNVRFDNGGAANPKIITGNYRADDQTLILADAVVNDFGGDHTLEELRLDGQLNFSGTITFTNNVITSDANSSLTLGTADIIIDGGNVRIFGDDNVIVNGDVTVINGLFTIAANATLTGTAGGTLTVQTGRTLRMFGVDNFPTGFGTVSFEGTTSRALYDALTDQTIRGGINYAELELGRGGIKTAGGNLDINGSLDLNGAITFDLATFDHTLALNVFNGTNSSITSSVGSSFTFDGNANAQTLQAAGTGSYLFQNLIIDNTLNTAVRTFNMDALALTAINFSAITNATARLDFDIDGNFVLGNGTGTFSLGAGVLLLTNGNNNFSIIESQYATFTIDTNSTIRFDGNAQELPGIPYGNLQFSGNGNKTALGNMDINGDVIRVGGSPDFVDNGLSHTIAGNWALGTNETPAASQTGTMTFDGANQTLTGSNFNNIVFAGTDTKTINGNLSLSGNLTINDGSTVDASIRGITIDGNWDDSGTGTFIQTTGFVQMEGTTANQTVSSNPNSTFGDFRINKTNNSFETVTALTDFTVARDFEFDANDASFDLNGQTVFIGRDWRFNVGTTFTANSGTLHFNGDIQQDILNFAGDTNDYFNITFSGAGEKNLSQEGMDINGEVFIDGTTFNAGNQPLSVAGDWTNTGSFEHTNTLTLDGADQNLSSSTFHDITTSGSGTKLLTGNISLDGRMIIEAGTTLDVGVGNNFITVDESWENNGTFVERNGTVTFIGASSNITTGATGPTVGRRFYNLVINSGLARENFFGDIDVENDLTVISGFLRTNTNDVFVGGSFVNNGTFEHNNNASTLTFDGTSGSHTFSPGTSEVRNIVVDAAGATYTLGSNLTQQAGGGRSFTLNNGTFETDGFSISNLGPDGVVQVNNGTLNISAGSTLTLGARGIVNNNGGIFMLVGDALAPAVLTSNQTSDNNLIQVVQTAGTIHARDYIIERLRVNGVDIQGGAIDATNNFSEGTFALGATNGNAYLTLTGLDFGAGIDVDNVIFNSGPTFNVSRTSGNGAVTFTNSSGTLTGETFDEDDADPGTLINFTFPGGFYWDAGGDGVSWNDAANWSGNTIPDATTNVFLEHSIGGVTGAYTVNVTGTDAETLRLTMDAEGGNAISLILNGQNLNINENIQIGVNTTLTQTNATDVINVVGNWTNEGNFNEGTSTVTFVGTSGTHQISTRGASDPFFNLRFNASGATYTLQNDIDVDNNFILDDGIFTVSASQRLFAGGDWTINGGTFNPGDGEVIFDRGGTSTQTIDGTTFNDFRTDNSTGTGTATKIINGSLTVEDDLVIGANTTLDGNTGIHRIEDNWTNNAGASGFTQSAGGAVVFFGGGQTIGGLITTFGDVFFQGNGTKLLNADISVTGNVNIVSPVTVEINDGFSIDGVGGTNQLNMSGGVLRLEGIAPNTNFPSGFETNNLSGGIVDYVANGPQDIFATTYFNLRVRRLAAGTLQTKTLTGDITVTDDLLINDVDTELDVAGFTILLSDDIGFPAGGRQIVWNGGTLIHNGTLGFNIDPDITGFNNLIFTGSGDKFMNGNLTITGDVTVQSGVRFEMNTFTMTSDGTGVFTLTANARLDSDIPATTGPAFPTNFSSYSLDQSSRTIMRSNTDKTIYTNGGTITYGELNIAFEGTVTPDGFLDVDGDFLLLNNLLFLEDGGFDINVSGANVDMRNYTATANTFTFDGTDQLVQFLNGDVNPDIITFNNLIFSGSGEKPFTSGDDLMIVNGDFTIETGIDVTANIDFQIRGNWTNNGSFSHTNGFFTFDGTGIQTIDPGVNSFDAITFSNGGANAKTIVNNGFDINDNMVINVGATADFGALTHDIAAGTITNDGTWITSSANLNFDRAGNQNIPAITALDINLLNDGTKIMQGDWSVDDLTIANNVNLDANNTSNFNITLTGNWINDGQFFRRLGSVAFESNNTDPKTIQTNGSDFNNLTFNQAQTNARTYTLTNNTEVDGDLTIGSGATLDVNGNALTFGDIDNPNVIETLLVQAGGSLELDASSALLADCTDGNSSIIIEGTLSIVGDPGNSASVTRSGGGNRIDIDITTGTIAARFYEMRFLVDEGLDIQAGATIDPVNNLSDGSWSEINTSAAAVRRYLIIEADATGLPDISNVNFNHGTTPTLARHFNVQRSAAAIGTITFAPSIGGLMGTEIYEDDGDGTKIEWPPATIATWTGAVDRDWHTAGNWSPMTVPNNTIEAFIPLTPNQPIISLADATCQTLTISDGNLIVDAGFDLTVITDAIIATGASIGGIFVGDPTSEITIGGGWAVGPNGIFSANGGEVTFTASTGSVNIVTQGNPFNDLVFSGSATFSLANNLDIDGNLTITSGNLSPSTNNYNFTAAGDINNVGGTFLTSTNGTITLDGDNQTITGMMFDRLTVDGTGVKTMAGVVNINDILIVNSTIQGAAGSLIEMDANVTINASGTFDDGGETHTFSGVDWTGLGGYVGTGTINFDGGGHDINVGSFNNLEFTGTGAIDLFGDVNVTGDVTIRNTINTFRASTFLIDNTTGTGTFTLEDGEQIFILGPNNFPSNFAAYNMGATSFARYQGLIDQTIAPITYGNLFLFNENTKTLAGNIEVQTDLILNNSTLDVSASNFRITLGDDFDNDNNVGGLFMARQGEVILNGASTTDNQDLRVGAIGTSDFFRITVNKPSDALPVRIGSNNLIVGEDLRVVSGEFSANGRIVTVSGSLLASGGIFARSGTYVLDQTVGSASIQMNNSVISNIEINSGATYTLLDDFDTDGNFTLTSGTFNTNGQTAFLGDGNDVISISGTYIVSPGGTLELGNGASLIVNSGGEIQVVGTASELASVQSAGTGDYNFTVNGDIQAQHYVFDGMGNNGIFINSGGVIDATNNFSNGTFINGDFGGTLLRVENTQTFTGASAIMNVSFPDNPGGGAFNVTKSISTSGELEFFNASGLFDGEDFDNDPNDLITWTGNATIVWDGSESTDWYDPDNWTPAQVPTITDDALIGSGANVPIINVSGAVVNNLEITNIGFLSISTADAGVDLNIAGALTINGVVTMVSSNDRLEVQGDWARGPSGSFTAGVGSTVAFTSPVGLQTVNNGTSPFFNIEINTGGLVQVSSSTDVNNDFTILAGEFDVTSLNRTLSVGGNFSNSGTFTPRSGRVIFNTSNAITNNIDIGSSAFADVEINGNSSAIYQIVNNNMTVNGDLDVNSGAFKTNGFVLNMGNGSNVSVADEFEVDANSTVNMGTGAAITVASGGLARLVGSDASNVATVSGGSGRFSFLVSSGGELEARFYAINFINVTGLRMAAGSIINTTNNLSDGTFSNGEPGGRYLFLQNSFADYAASNIIFNSGPTVNVRRVSGSGVVDFEDASGLLSGPDFEDDVPDGDATTGFIRWNFTNPVLTWTGNASDNNWHNAANWDDGMGVNSVPVSITNVFIPVTGFDPIISNADAVAANVNISAGATLTINTDRDLAISEGFVNAGTFTVANGSNTVIEVGDTWSNAGVFNNGGSSLVRLTADSGNKTITSGGSPFCGLEINSAAPGTVVFSTLDPLDVDCDFTIIDGELEIGDVSHTFEIAGNWNVTAGGTFTNGGGSVLFDGSGAQSLTQASGDPFNNLTIGGSGTVTLQTDIDNNGNFAISSTLVAGANDIDVFGNWTNTGTFTAGTSTVTLNGNSQQQVSSTGGETFFGLVVNNDGAVFPQILANNAITVTDGGSLSLTDGVVETNNIALLTMNDNTTLNGGTSSASYVSGPMAKIGQQDFIFPIGKGTIFARVGVTGMTASATLNAEYFDDDFGNSASEPSIVRVSRIEYWDVTRTAGTGEPFITLFWEDGARSLITDPATLVVAHFESTEWLNIGNGATTGSATTGSIRSAFSVNNFSPFTIASTDENNPLPITLSSFEGETIDGVNHLTWETSSEINNDYFELQRSFDGVNYEVIGEVKGAGTSEEVNQYSFIDKLPFVGNNFYRLRQVDFDGTSETMNEIVLLTIEARKDDFSLSIYPNPTFQGDINARISGDQNTPIVIKMIDLYGKEVYSDIVTLSAVEGDYKLKVTESLKQGIYIVTVQQAGLEMKSKVIITR